MLMGGLGHACVMPAPAAARPWPQLWLGRSIPDGLRSPEWAAKSAAKPSCRGQPWVLGRSLLDCYTFE
jgi:hypothetical protein